MPLSIVIFYYLTTIYFRSPDGNEKCMNSLSFQMRDLHRATIEESIHRLTSMRGGIEKKKRGKGGHVGTGARRSVSFEDTNVFSVFFLMWALV